MRERHTRVVHVIEPADYGGAESVVRTLTLAARRRGEEPVVAALLQEAGSSPLVESLRGSGVMVEEVRVGRRRYWAEIRALAAVLRAQAADLVHTHVYHADLVGYFAARRRRLPVVATVHGYTGGDWKNRLYERLDLVVLRHFDAVLCVSEGVAARVRRAGASPARVRVVPNGFAGESPMDRAVARRTLDLPLDAAVVGWIGRLSPEKGPDVFVDVVRRLVGQSTLAAVIGDGPQRRELTSRIGAAERNIRLLGSRADAGRLVSAFDVLAITSRTEGLPITLLEAMAASVPVVTFAVGGIPDVVDARSAWLVPEGDVGALRLALRQALGNRAEAERRAVAALEIVRDRFSVDRWLDQVERVYDEVLR